MSEKDYPEEIYPLEVNTVGDVVRRTPNSHDLESAYDLGLSHGKEQTDPLAGFSNLTQAIKDGVRIDWEQLDGRKAKCVHPELGVLTHEMLRYKKCSQDNPGGWIGDESPALWSNAISASWRGHSNWSLWIEGEIPVEHRTADELELWTCFKGRCMGEVRDCVLYRLPPHYNEDPEDRDRITAELRVVGINLYSKLSCEGASPSPVNWLAEQVEVIEVYGIGTFQTPKEEN